MRLFFLRRYHFCLLSAIFSRPSPLLQIFPHSPFGASIFFAEISKIRFEIVLMPECPNFRSFFSLWLLFYTNFVFFLFSFCNFLYFSSTFWIRLDSNYFLIIMVLFVGNYTGSSPKTYKTRSLLRWVKLTKVSELKIIISQYIFVLYSLHFNYFFILKIFMYFRSCKFKDLI